MAIDRIPGVGPTNADIATAVAAPSAATIASTIATTPAVSAQITASVPTAAAIATAVAAPSSATIQSLIQTYAAPASVTMAAITSSITTNAASAGVTLAAIGTQVANNAPSANNWTLVGTGTPLATSFTFSGLSGYKAYKLIWYLTTSSAQQQQIILNGDTAANYHAAWLSGQNTAVIGTTYKDSTYFYLAQGSNVSMMAQVFINGATNTQYKDLNWRVGSPGSGAYVSGEGLGIYAGTAALTSITVQNGGAANFTGGRVYLYGAN